MRLITYSYAALFTQGNFFFLYVCFVEISNFTKVHHSLTDEEIIDFLFGNDDVSCDTTAMDDDVEIEAILMMKR